MRHKRSLRRYTGRFARRFLEALGALAVVAGALALFVIPALLVGLVLRRPLMSFTQGLSKAIESTKLMSPS